MSNTFTKVKNRLIEQQAEAAIKDLPQLDFAVMCDIGNDTVTKDVMPPCQHEASVTATIHACWMPNHYTLAMCESHRLSFGELRLIVTELMGGKLPCGFAPKTLDDLIWNIHPINHKEHL